MTEYKKLTKPELEQELALLKNDYENMKLRCLSLDISRGQSNVKQLELCEKYFTCVDVNNSIDDGIDCRNYGTPFGLPKLRKIFASLLSMPIDNVILGGNSSLTMMFDAVMTGMLVGFGDGAWMTKPKVKFICNVPGYDRHFAVCEYFGIEMINVEMTESGPNMDEIEQLVASDDAIKGMWCVPKYSNPCGTVYSNETVRRIANLQPAAKDFRVFWDNAYSVHYLGESLANVANIFNECEKAGNADLPIVFASTSKIGFPGGGVAALGASDKNLEILKKRITTQSIGPDKTNQLRHIRFFESYNGILKHMAKVSAILTPKFKKVTYLLCERLGGLGVASWKNPNGGYFVSVDVYPGCAKKIVALCKEAGLQLTPAGATYPYGLDPNDSNIRIAPTSPTDENLQKSVELFCLCVKIAALEKMLQEN